MKSRWGCVGVVLLVLLCMSGLLNLFLIGSSIHTVPKFTEETIQESAGSDPDKIAVIRLSGLISSSIEGTEGETMVDDMKIALKQAVDDKKVKAIVLNIDSPGGEVTAADVIYNAVRRARAQKPVVIYMGSLAASGGYYISCGGSYLMASDTTFTGSIGVIMEGMNYSQLMGKIGLSPMVFRSGKFKDMLSGSRDMTDDEKKYVQGLIDQTFEKFRDIVAKERHIAPEALDPNAPNPIADGRVISGKDALGDKLIDGLGEIEDAYAKAKELGNAPAAEVVYYKPKARFGLASLFRSSAQASPPRIEINLAQKLVSPLEPGKLYMLPDFYAQ